MGKAKEIGTFLSLWFPAGLRILGADQIKVLIFKHLTLIAIPGVLTAFRREIQGFQTIIRSELWRWY